MRLIVLLIVLAAVAVRSSGQSPAATLRGSASETDGTPVAGAAVYYTRIPVFLPPNGGPPRLARGETVVSASTSTDEKGSFEVTGIPSGKYLVCVEARSAPLLNPCKWSTSPMIVVPAGGAANVAIVLQRGRFLRVRVNDPLKLLPGRRTASLRDLPQLTVGVVFGTGGFLAADSAGTDMAGQDLRMAVPTGQPMKLRVFSRHVTIQDESGAELDSGRGANIPFQAARDKDPTFTIRITGRVKGTE
jgi:hypothetical protein